MNVKRWLISSVAVFVVFSVVGYVVHGVLLDDIYQQTALVWRSKSDMQSMMWLMSIGTAIVALMFAFLYTKGYERNKPGVWQGLRFGLYIWLLVSVGMAFGWYVVLPIPAALSIYWVISGLIQSLLAGVVVGLVYKEQSVKRK